MPRAHAALALDRYRAPFGLPPLSPASHKRTHPPPTITPPRPQPIFSTASLTGVAWIPQLGFLACALTYTELSKMATRRNPDGWWARKMQW
jgi:hypothetical protein